MCLTSRQPARNRRANPLNDKEGCSTRTTTARSVAAAKSCPWLAFEKSPLDYGNLPRRYVQEHPEKARPNPICWLDILAAVHCGKARKLRGQPQKSAKIRSCSTDTPTSIAIPSGTAGDVASSCPGALSRPSVTIGTPRDIRRWPWHFAPGEVRLVVRRTFPSPDWHTRDVQS